jgi:hypothetical protein
LRDEMGAASLGRGLLIVPVAQVLAACLFLLASKGFVERIARTT